MNAATSAGIQKLEEELGASIENEDASSRSTLTETHRLDHESQTSDQQVVAGQQSTDQDTREDISQVDIPAATCSTGITSELRTHGDQSEDRTTTTLDSASAKAKGVEINEDYLETENETVEETEGFDSQDTDNGSLRDALSVHESKDSDRTVDTDEISRTIDTSDEVRSVDTSDTSAAVDTSDASGMVNTSDLISTGEKSDTSRTLDPVDSSGTVDPSDMSFTVNASNTSRTVDTSEVNRTVDSSDETRSVDSSADKSGTVDTSDITETEQETK